jgi:DNA-3-methyladenine glycosylase II
MCSQWAQMDDEAIIEELVAIRGIGRWTAEMFLIFHLMRPNVLPLDDVGLIKGISQQLLQRRAGLAGLRPAKWARPGRHSARLATWYLWRSLDPLPVEY